MKKIFQSILLALLLINVLTINNVRADDVTSDESDTTDSVVISSDNYNDVDRSESILSDDDVEYDLIHNDTQSNQDDNTLIAEDTINECDPLTISSLETVENLDELQYFSNSKVIDGVIITVTAKEGVFPDNAVLSVEKVEIKDVFDAISEIREADKSVAVSYTYDIKVLDDKGNELTPNGNVSVKFSFDEKIQDAINVDVYHTDDNLNVESIDTSVSENTDIDHVNTDIEVTTDSFSYYTVEFTYNNLIISIDGNSTNDLLTILNGIGLNGSIQNVDVSNPDLFDAFEKNGIWYVEAKQAFTSDEWMKVTVDGIEYEIVVTDAVNSTFYIEAIEATTIKLSKVSSPTVGTAKYGINNTSPSTDYTYGDSINLSAGQKCYWTITSTTTAFTTSKYLKFTSTGKIKAGGNLSSLIGGNTSIPRRYCFARLFYNCTTLIDASAINFGSITSFNTKIYAYMYMFQNCTGLTAAPELPATTLASGCYSGMFENCTGLTSAPKLPATTLASGCYSGMFRNCTGLTAAPELPATTLADNCYVNMFYGCTGLTSAPKLSATTLASGCYSGMFYDCTGLTSAPELPATTLASGCYENMFYGCTSLTAAPVLPATDLADHCYSSMFRGCTSLTAAPVLPATTLADYCYSYMLRGCTSLTAAPVLPATDLDDFCYFYMFEGCTGLTSAPKLSATTLASSCYGGMFQNCTGLTAAPELPATTLASGCYSGMFRNCTGIMLSETQTEIYQKPYRIPKEGTGTTASSALGDMFANTGGTFTGTPSINTTYYVPSTLEYTITIPASVNVADLSIPITYEIIGTDLNMSVTSVNDWKLINNTSYIDYSLSETSFTLCEGTGTKNISMNINGSPTLAGVHDDVVTFTYVAS